MIPALLPPLFIALVGLGTYHWPRYQRYLDSKPAAYVPKHSRQVTS